MADETLPGPLALVGGGEWRSGAVFDETLLGSAGGEVVVLPTGAAYEHPQRSITLATSWFASLGAKVRPAMVLTRRDAEDDALVELVAGARFVYLSGGSPLHIRSVLKDSAVLGALIATWRSGAVVAGTSAGAMVLSDPMVDPRGGAFTVGLGLVTNLAVVPHFDGEWGPQLRRTVALAPDGCALVALGEGRAIIRDPDGTWSSAGDGPMVIVKDGIEQDVASLPKG